MEGEDGEREEKGGREEVKDGKGGDKEVNVIIHVYMCNTIWLYNYIFVHYHPTFHVPTVSSVGVHVLCV